MGSRATNIYQLLPECRHFSFGLRLASSITEVEKNHQTTNLLDNAVITATKHHATFQINPHVGVPKCRFD